jgi:hypothetical protein
MAWTMVATDAANATQVQTGTFPPQGLATWSPELASGDGHLTVEVRWHGAVIASAAADVHVTPLCRDADGDGLCGAPSADCDDDDPFVRPGLPDLLGDNRDNDCDGKVAGDADGDGFEADGPRPPPTPDQLGQIAKVYAGRPDLAASILTVPPKNPLDFDDQDPNCMPNSGNRDCAIWSAPGREPAWTPPGDVTARDVARVLPDGTLQVRVAARIWSTPPLSVPDYDVGWVGETGGVHMLGAGFDGLGIEDVHRWRTSAGHPAWLVVVQEEAVWNVKTFIGRVGFVVVPLGGDRLQATRIDLGELNTTMGAGTNGLVTPTLTPTSLTAGDVRYLWHGDALVRVAP